MLEANNFSQYYNNIQKVESLKIQAKQQTLLIVINRNNAK